VLLANDYVKKHVLYGERSDYCTQFLQSISFFLGKKFPPNREPLRVKGNRFSFGASLLALAQGRAHPVFAMKSPGVPFTP
jgi:hypothetical protein